MSDVLLTPQMQQLIAAYTQAHPNGPKNQLQQSGWLSRDPQGAIAWMQLDQQLHSLGLPEDYHANAIGQITKDPSVAETLIKAALVYAPFVAGGIATGWGAGVGAAAPTVGSSAVTYGPTLEQLGASPEEMALANSGVGAVESAGDLASLGETGGAGVADAGTTGAATGVPAAGDATNVAADQSLGTTGAFDSAGNWVPGSTEANPASFGTTGATSTGFSGFVKQLGDPRVLVPAGLSIGAAALQSHAASEAADQQAQSTRDALGVQAQEFNTNTGLNVAQANQNTQGYNQTVSNLAPYRGIGASALSSLGYHLGLPGYEGGNSQVVNAPAPIVPIQPLAVPPPITPPGSSQPGQSIPNQAFVPTTQKTGGLPQLSTGNNWSGGGAVSLRAPSGQVSQVPPDQVDHYLALGAQRV